MRKMKVSLLAVCLAVLMAATFAFSACEVRNVTLRKPTVDTEALYGEYLSQAIAAEGIVLLENHNKALPLKETENKLAVFGWGATDGGFVLGGTGSGGGSGGGEVFLRRALEQTEANALRVFPNGDPFGWNFQCFPELFQLGADFQESRISVPIDPQPGQETRDLKDNFRLYEPEVGAELMGRAYDFADGGVAIMVISRLGSENKDLPLWQHRKWQGEPSNTNRGALISKSEDDATRHYLQTTPEEEAVMAQIAAAGFKKTILLVNTCNTMELGFADSYGFDAVLSVGAPGKTGAYAIRRVLNGTVAPSGKTVDTWVYDAESEPSFANGATNGVINYTGGNRFVEYREDIYVGYRYFETADRMGTVDYEATVQYPFGFGRTYTTFDWTVTDISPAPGTAISADTKFSVEVEVKNTGNAAGQDVVQAYMTLPYTGGIEKPYLVLTAFAKTELLYPEAEKDATEGKYNVQIITLEFEAYDFASYDCYDLNDNDFMGYELDAGDYELRLQTDSHTVKATKGDITQNGKIAYGSNGVKFDTETIFTDLNGNKRVLQPAQNYFTNVAGKNMAADNYSYGIPIDGSGGTNRTFGTGGGATSTKIPLMSRGNFEELPEKAASRISGYTIYTGGANKPGWNVPITGTKPHTGESNGLSLTNENNNALSPLGRKLGANYDHADWDRLLDQMTPTEMWNLVSDGNYFTREVGTVGKPKMLDLDGPSGYSDWANGGAIPDRIRDLWTRYPVETVIAQTWSRKLAYNFGMSMGRTGSDSGVGGWYGPACNIHRNMFDGRNFEYFSEDPVLSGVMSADISYGARVFGVYTYVKHFVANETETNRGHLRTWLSEQALREIYLKPFEIAVKKGHATGIMNSFNYLGAIWTGGSVPLQQNIVRGEWGFRGAICTDYCGSSDDGNMNGDQGLRAGTDLWIGSARPRISSTDSTESLILLREASKNLLYAFANAWLYNEEFGQEGLYDNSYFAAVLE